MTVRTTWFKARSTPNALDATVDGHDLQLRGWWGASDSESKGNGDAVTFVRISEYESERGYMYVAVDWESRSIVGTAWGESDQKARKFVLEDLERRGWSFS